MPVLGSVVMDSPGWGFVNREQRGGFVVFPKPSKESIRPL